MSGGMRALDVGFPNFSGEETVEEKIDTILNYQYMTNEYLRYTLRNLDIARNMNQSSVDKFTGLITEPIFARIAGAEGSLAQLSLTAEGLRVQIEDTEERLISSITQTALGIRTEVAALESGLTSSITQTAAGILAEVADVQSGLNASIMQTASSIRAEVTDVREGLTSVITQTASSIRADVRAVDGRVTSLNQTVKGFTLTASNSSTGRTSTLSLMSDGVLISSANIAFSGLVSFVDLSTSNGSTTINAGNITTGTMSAVTVRSVSGVDHGFQVWSGSGSASHLVGGIRHAIVPGMTNYHPNRMYLYTQPDWVLHLLAGHGMAIESEGHIFMSAVEMWDVRAANIQIGIITNRIGFFGAAARTRQTVANIPTDSVAAAGTNRTKINQLLDALRGYGLIG
jgi:hypothetical protein